MFRAYQRLVTPSKKPKVVAVWRGTERAPPERRRQWPEVRNLESAGGSPRNPHVSWPGCRAEDSNLLENRRVKGRQRPAGPEGRKAQPRPPLVGVDVRLGQIRTYVERPRFT